MKNLVRILPIALLLPIYSTAEVAETYEIEAGRATGVASKVAVDIIGHYADSTSVWLATGKGANYSFDDGQSWYIANMTNGLPADNLSAVFSIDGRVWVGSNHNEFIADRLMTLSDGLSYSDDDGATWTTLNFGESGLNIPFVIGGDRTIFDITGHRDVGFFDHRTTDNDVDWLFFSAFAGGFLASQDGGINWRRIFPSRSDSIQYNLPNQAPSLRNRYFASVADTSHQDSLFVWTGTAAGVFQYVFAPPSAKLFTSRINDISFCPDCFSVDETGLLFAGQSGLGLSSTAGNSFGTRFLIDGLPYEDVLWAGPFGGGILAVTADPGAAGFEIAISSDGGDSFVTESGPWNTSIEPIHVDGIAMGDRFYLALGQAGLFVTPDAGAAWAQVPLDTLNTEPSLQVANALDLSADTLFVGTDSGLVKLTLNAIGDILAAESVPFADTDTTGARVTRIRHQTWAEIEAPERTHSILWTVHQPASTSGIPMVSRFGPDVDTVVTPGDPPDTTFDTLAFSWDYYRQGLDIYDINFFRDTVFAVGENAIWFSPTGEEMTNFFSARQYQNDTLVVANLDQDTVTVMEVRGDTVIFGTLNGVAVSRDRGETFRIKRVNTDTLAADLVVNHSYITTLFGLAGDFIPALGVQYRETGPARIWAGARPAEFGGQGISYAEYDPAGGGAAWETVLADEFAWNFEFVGDTIYAATNSGLYMNDGTLDSLNTVWEKIDFIDQSTGEVLVDPEVPVYGVAMVDTTLWVGTDDGTVAISRHDLGRQQLFVRVDSTTPPDEVYAFPVPFSPLQGQTVDFHFTVGTPGNVTVEVYDFAMNLVATPIDNVFYPAGIYPPQGSQGRTWDGYNDQGDLVAVGVYYFKVEYESGETRWGKLAVIP